MANECRMSIYCTVFCIPYLAESLWSLLRHCGIMINALVTVIGYIRKCLLDTLLVKIGNLLTVQRSHFGDH